MCKNMCMCIYNVHICMYIYTCICMYMYYKRICFHGALPTVKWGTNSGLAPSEATEPPDGATRTESLSVVISP